MDEGKEIINFRETYMAFISLSVYRGLLLDCPFSKLNGLLKYISCEGASLEGFIENYCEFYHELIKSNAKGNLKIYIVDTIIYHDNPFTAACENTNFCDMDKKFIGAVSKDLEILKTVSEITSFEVKAFVRDKLCTSEYELKLIESLPNWDNSAEYPNKTADLEPVIFTLLSSISWKESVEELANFHRDKGTGLFIKYKAFVWDRTVGNGYLRGIDDPDPVTLSDLIGYEAEREEVITNTQQFLKGYSANNVLLYGDRGTGKSSTVKAILNEYYNQGLRIIEVPKMYLTDFPKIIKALNGRKQNFIIFVDDLVFEDSEENYTTLKAILEGGLENRPKNVLIYATSNRRHLIKEKFSDRMGLQSSNADEEIRSADTIQEKLSLADRFGITVVFSSPDKNRYLEIVEGIAEKRGIIKNKEQLHKEALKWELWYNGRSPRTARQFIDWLEGQGRE